MIRVRHRLDLVTVSASLFAALVTLGAVAACGARSNTLDDGSGDTVVIVPQVPAAPADAAATVPPADAGHDAADAAPPLPCHLVRTGDPYKTIAFSEPTYSFRQDGVLARPATATAGPHVVQFGNVYGQRTGVWDDPPIYAAEYDVSTWPPTVVRDPIELFQSMHDPADLVALPNNQLALVWWFDNDGIGPHGVKFRTIDGASWQMAPDRFLVENGSNWSRPVLTPARDALVATYEMPATPADGGYVDTAWVGVFGTDGAARGAPLPLWTNTTSSYGSYLPTSTVARTGTDVLVAVAFPSCGDGNASPYCSANAIVVLRLVDATTSPHLARVAEVPIRDAARMPSGARLLADGEERTWLTWWETLRPTDGGTAGDSYLYAVPLSTSGAPTGPIESWFVTDPRNMSDYFATRAPLAGPLGTFYPVDIAVPTDGGSTREVHLLHRQRDVTAPLEDIVLPTGYTAFPAAVAQIPETRSLIVSYSTYPPGSTRGYGEIVKYGCQEDMH